MRFLPLSGSFLIMSLCAGVHAQAAPAENSETGLGADGTDASRNITSGYRDGYWDTSRNWHWWKDGSHHANYRTNRAGTYRDWDYATATVRDGHGQLGRKGNVAYAYRDGFWDTGRRWHSWNDEADRRNYRKLKGGNFSDWNHDRDGSTGWRD